MIELIAVKLKKFRHLFRHLYSREVLSPLCATQNATIRTSFTLLLTQYGAKVKIMVFSILEKNAFTSSWSPDGGLIALAILLVICVVWPITAIVIVPFVILSLLIGFAIRPFQPKDH